MLSARGVIIMITLAARVSMGEIGLVGEHNFYFSCLRTYTIQIFLGECLSEGF